MEYVKLGSTNLTVSRLCFGGLIIGPLQANLPLEEGAKVIARAFDIGVNFIDTAKLYKTYPYIRRAMELSQNKDIIVSSKSYDYTYDGMKESLREALDELGLKKLGIFSLHEQESRHTLRGHREAIEYLIEAKEKGLIQAIGVSTHYIEVVNEVCRMPEIDVIHPLYNLKGLGISDGGAEEMGEAIEMAYKNGKGIYAMKPLGGGNLTSNYDECMDFVIHNKHIHSIALGMQTIDEVNANVLIFEGKQVDEATKNRIKNRSKRLHIDSWCAACGTCVSACKNDALKIENDKLVVNREKCLLCGYCSAYCPEFCIKIV